MILNLTQHVGTAEQEGLIEPQNKDLIQKLLTFDNPPTGEEIIERAEKLADIAEKELNKETVDKEVMIGGAPFLMGPLEIALLQKNILPYYSFSRRTSEEIKQADGTIKKIQIFKHEKFILAASVGMGEPWEP